MEEKKEKLVIDGNAFYEIDLDCIREKQRAKEAEKEKKGQIKRQRK